MSEITEKGELFLGLQEFKKSGHKFIPADTSLSGLYGTDFPTFLNDEGFSSSDLKTCSSWLDYLLPLLNLSDNGTPFVTFIGKLTSATERGLLKIVDFLSIETAYPQRMNPKKLVWNWNTVQKR